jgi:acyl-CoA synthetase (AMP-forming)/AMP-acid ligase II
VSAIRSFRDDFDALVARAPARTVVVDAIGDASHSYGALGILIRRYAALFAGGSGSAAGRRIMSLLPNSTEQLAAFLAALRAGAHFAPVAPDASAQEVRRWLDLVQPALTLVPWDLSRELRTLLAERRIATVSLPLDGTFAWLPPARDGDDAKRGPGRLYLTTSGSTGEPRAVVYDGDVLWSSACAFAGVHTFLDADARFLNFLPMSYLGGLFNLGLIPLACGGSVVVSEPLSGRTLYNFWQRTEQHEVNVLWLIPSLLKGLVTMAQKTRRQDIAGRVAAMRACFVGMSPTDKASKMRFEREFGIPVLENYGLCETTFLASERLNSRQRRVEGSVGEPIPGVELLLRPLEGSVDDAEILARTPYLFLGYLRADGEVQRPLAPDGFFATGDAGRIEESGTLVLRGRMGELIKKGDALVSLRALELLAETHELVAEAAAVAGPHEFYGQTAVLFVRFRDDQPDHRAAMQAFRPWLHDNLVRSHWPDGVIAVDDFPRTTSGKVAKASLRAEYLQRETANVVSIR